MHLYAFFHFLQAEIYAEIGEIINGTKEAKQDEMTVFKSLGKLTKCTHIHIDGMLC